MPITEVDYDRMRAKLHSTQLALGRYKRMYERAAAIADMYAPAWDAEPHPHKQGIMQFFRKDEPKSTSQPCQIPKGHCDSCSTNMDCYGEGNPK